jgi:adenine deaminase
MQFRANLPAGLFADLVTLVDLFGMRPEAVVVQGASVLSPTTRLQ